MSTTESKRYTIAFFDAYEGVITQVIVRNDDVKAALLSAVTIFYSVRSEEAKAECLAWLTGLLDSTDNLELIFEELRNNEIVVNILEIPPCP